MTLFVIVNATTFSLMLTSTTARAAFINDSSTAVAAQLQAIAKSPGTVNITANTPAFGTGRRARQLLQGQSAGADNSFSLPFIITFPPSVNKVAVSSAVLGLTTRINAAGAAALGVTQLGGVAVVDMIMMADVTTPGATGVVVTPPGSALATSSSSSNRTGLIAGLAVGMVVLVAAVLAAVLLTLKRKRQASVVAPEPEEPQGRSSQETPAEATPPPGLASHPSPQAASPVPAVAISSDRPPSATRTNSSRPGSAGRASPRAVVGVEVAGRASPTSQSASLALPGSLVPVEMRSDVPVAEEIQPGDHQPLAPRTQWASLHVFDSNSPRSSAQIQTVGGPPVRAGSDSTPSRRHTVDHVMDGVVHLPPIDRRFGSRGSGSSRLHAAVHHGTVDVGDTRQIPGLTDDTPEPEPEPYVGVELGSDLMSPTAHSRLQAGTPRVNVGSPRIAELH
ncbi:hypothetical protein V8C86DRAFT_2734238 [Haematococcus lacustris]